MKKKVNRYIKIIEKIFFGYYHEGAADVPFQREDIIRAAKDLRIILPKNLGDVTTVSDIAQISQQQLLKKHQKVKSGLFVQKVALLMHLLQLV